MTTATTMQVNKPGAAQQNQASSRQLKFDLAFDKAKWNSCLEQSQQEKHNVMNNSTTAMANNGGGVAPDNDAYCDLNQG